MNPLSMMVAPNGARKTKQEHPKIPMTEAEIALEAARCVDAGAQAFHLHVRDGAGRHSLDPNRYLSAISAIRSRVGQNLIVQITTEAVGRFSPDEQIETVRAVEPESVSIALKELVPDYSGESAAAELYGWMFQRKIALQHIIYGVDEFMRLMDLIDRRIVPGERHSMIFPLGRYAEGQESQPAELIPFLKVMSENGGPERFQWFVCAFGRAETQALVAAAALGGHCRVGFENSIFNADGSVAVNNAERLSDVDRALYAVNRPRATRNEALRALGRPD
jgi:3-keto-5-aminohexanoate cleavage enzyme